MTPSKNRHAYEEPTISEARSHLFAGQLNLKREIALSRCHTVTTLYTAFGNGNLVFVYLGQTDERTAHQFAESPFSASGE